MEETNSVIDCLNHYEAASGQQINFGKLSISFSANVSNELNNDICKGLRVNFTNNHGKYLGLPSLIGRNKYEVFEFIKEKAWNRMKGWRTKMLSSAGKEILLKSVVQTLPSYVMCVFVILIQLCEKLERMMNSFWWGKEGQNTGDLKWKYWNKLCTRKEEGGLGFRKLHDFNIAMLAKQSWNLLISPNSLASRVIRAR